MVSFDGSYRRAGQGGGVDRGPGRVGGQNEHGRDALTHLPMEAGSTTALPALSKAIGAFGLTASADRVPFAEVCMYRAQWAGEVVRPEGAEDVRQVSGEARQPLLGVDLVGRIHWHVVVEHLNPQGAQRQGRRVHHHTDRRPHLTVSNGEVLVVDLEAVRGHRDEVFAGWEVAQCLGGTQLTLVTLGDDGRLPGGVANRRPPTRSAVWASFTVTRWSWAVR